MSTVRPVFRPCDVSKNADVEALVETTVEKFGHLDYACNNAGIHNPTPQALAWANVDVWDRIIAVNLKGPFSACSMRFAKCSGRGNAGHERMLTHRSAGHRGDEIPSPMTSSGGTLEAVGVPLSAVTANGGIDKLKAALHESLDAGLGP